MQSGTNAVQASELEAQRRAGHRRLRFTPTLEELYRDQRQNTLSERARPVAISAVVLFLIYAALDPFLLPAELARQTIMVRLLLTCPVILLVWALSYAPVSPGRFARWYAGAYVWGGLSVVLIIALARRQSFPLPYDGILLMLMFGYFVMGLPFRTASVGSALIIGSYIGVEAAFDTPAPDILMNAFFLLTANLIGMVGSWLSEYRQRAHFLDRHLLELSREKAEADSAAKTHLISVASHDLRQPLNVVNLLLDNLSAADLPPDQRPLVRQLSQSVTHFNGLLGSLLDISRIQENMIRPVITAVPVTTVLQQARDALQTEALEQGVSLAVEHANPTLAVQADPHLLHRVLQNLIGNALQHSNAETITLGVDAGDRQHRLWVRDDGRGMPESEQGRIFETFYRRESSAQAQPGLGLGLAITRELTGMMSGEHGVVSREGLGSTFWITLPAAPTVAAQPAVPVSNELPAGERILLVEDDTTAREALQQILERWGFTVLSVANGTLARRLARQQAFGLAIIDLHLPDIAGDILYRELREANVVGGGVLVTADTGRKQAYDPAQRLWLMHKPIVPARLRAALIRIQNTEPV
ncbi:response regulator [Marinobacter halodurans]|uniref:histidine kinase n=1 Tax=Marinobacter halodurans TaxID=2528979 RepID=A0ABY1ZPW1_9GAMM|nr:hybrid sensor histidine kinase/response regulator [Marinobacter halodurans]TBW58888.1 response regulator [Marinobacter halodurans]